MNLRRTLPSLVAAAAAVVPAALIVLYGEHAVFPTARFHMGFVTLTSALDVALAVALTVAGARRRDGRTVAVGFAFSTMAAILAVHALATPSMLLGQNGLVSFSAGATLPVGGLLLLLSAAPALRGPRHVRTLILVEATVAAAILAVAALGAAYPALLPAVPTAGSPLAYANLILGATIFGFLAWRALRTFRLTRRGADLAVAVGLAWLATSLYAAMTSYFVELAFWIGHGSELLGIMVVAGATALDLRRADASNPLVGDLRAERLVLAEEAFLGAQVRALMLRLGQKDAYTEEHTREVALLAVQVGEQLELPPARLRKLALGGLLHDMGKLSVPDAVLKKPGALDDGEFAVIRRHPQWGADLLSRLGGFGDVRDLVLDHHERLDGKGYPRGLGEHDLPLDTRILTVCDVYSALVANRVYRSAFTAHDALALLRRDTGTAFDPRCVEALARVLDGGAALPLAA